MGPRGVTEHVTGAAIEVHKHIGPGLLKSGYEECFCHEPSLRGIPFERQRPLHVKREGIKLDCGHRLDLLVAGAVVVEIRAATSIQRTLSAQLPGYL